MQLGLQFVEQASQLAPSHAEVFMLRGHLLRYLERFDQVGAQTMETSVCVFVSPKLECCACT